MEAELTAGYHAARATQELDLGLSCNDMKAARAHLGLANLHMERVRALSARRRQPPASATNREA